MSAASIAFVKEVAALSPTLTLLLEEHVRDNFGEVLPHLFLGDVTRRTIALMQVPSSGDGLTVRRELRAILDAMEVGYAMGNPDVQELIATSFLENLPTKAEPGSGIRELVGPRLGRQLRKLG